MGQQTLQPKRACCWCRRQLCPVRGSTLSAPDLLCHLTAGVQCFCACKGQVYGVPAVFTSD
eukprot:12843118-Prorocentrum_lima.AAC.1